MKRRRLTYLVLSAALVFTLACSFADQVIQNFTATQTPQPEAPVFGPEVKLDGGLTPFQSYTARLTLKFSGEDTSGTPLQTTFEVLDSAEKASGLRHLLAHSEIQGQKPGSVEIYQGAKTSYLVSTERSGCLQLTAETLAARSEMNLRPADIFQSLHAGELLDANQIVDGLTVNHYRLQTIQLRLGTAKKGDAEIWIATNGGYVVRMTGWAEGLLSVGAGASYGRVDWEYNLTGLNETKISLPPDCQTLVKNDLPMPEGVSDLVQNGDELDFHVASAPAAVMDFYRLELMKRGWTVVVDAGGGKAFSQSATKDKLTLEMLVFTGTGGSDVKVRKR